MPGRVWRGKADVARLDWARPGVARLGKADEEIMKGTTLKARRKALGLSLAEAADQVHVTPRTWCRWEAGERKIPGSALELFCNKNKLKYP